MSKRKVADRVGRKFIGRGLAWAQVQHPGAVARVIQFAIARTSSSHKKAPSTSGKAVGLEAAHQAAGVPAPLEFHRLSGIQAASAIAGVTPDQAATIRVNS